MTLSHNFALPVKEMATFKTTAPLRERRGILAVAQGVESQFDERAGEQVEGKWDGRFNLRERLHDGRGQRERVAPARISPFLRPIPTVAKGLSEKRQVGGERIAGPVPADEAKEFEQEIVFAGLQQIL